MRFTEFTEIVSESIIKEAQPAVRLNPDEFRLQGPANVNQAPRSADVVDLNQYREQLRNLSAAERQAIQREISTNRSLWQRLAGWGARTAGRHAGATIASGVTGPAAPAVAAIANLALLGYDVVTLGQEIFDWAQGNDIELPRASAETAAGSIPLEAPPRPDSSNSQQRGRNLRGSQLAWDRLYGSTHNLDGSPQLFDPDPDVPVFQPDAEPAPADAPADAPVPPQETPVPDDDAPPRPREEPRPVIIPQITPEPEPEPEPAPSQVPAPSAPQVEPYTPTQPDAPEPQPSGDPIRRPEETPIELPDTPEPLVVPDRENVPREMPAPDAPQVEPDAPAQPVEPKPSPSDTPLPGSEPTTSPVARPIARPTLPAPITPTLPDVDVASPPAPATSTAGGPGRPPTGRTRRRDDAGERDKTTYAPAKFTPIQIADPLQLRRYQQFK